MLNEDFWKSVKPFLANKGCLSNNGIMVVRKDEIITNGEILVEDFSNHYINIVEKCSDTKPNVLVDNRNNFKNIVNVISERKYHPSIFKVEIKCVLINLILLLIHFRPIATGRVKSYFLTKILVTDKIPSN